MHHGSHDQRPGEKGGGVCLQGEGVCLHVGGGLLSAGEGVCLQVGGGGLPTERKAGGTHPTGMLSCSKRHFVMSHNNTHYLYDE